MRADVHVGLSGYDRLLHNGNRLYALLSPGPIVVLSLVLLTPTHDKKHCHRAELNSASATVCILF